MSRDFTSDRIHPGPAEPPEARIVNINRAQGRRPKSSPSLELQVNIGDRDHAISLSLDALDSYGLSGPVAVEELRGIRIALEDLVQILKAAPGNGMTFDGRSVLDMPRPSR